MAVKSEYQGLWLSSALPRFDSEKLRNPPLRIHLTLAIIINHEINSTIALTFCFSVSFGQLVTVQLDEYPLTRFEERNNSKEYPGTYTLGFSEQSWEVTFIGDQNMATIQTTLHVWNREGYEDKTNTYSGIKIKGNKAYYKDGTLIIEFVKFNDTDNTLAFRHVPKVMLKLDKKKCFDFHILDVIEGALPRNKTA